MGNELVVDKSAEKIVLVAGGIGITPFVPVLQDLLEGENGVKEVVLVYGVNAPNEFLYEAYFRALEKSSSMFRFVPVVAFDDQWPGEKGFVTSYLTKTDLAGTKIYMCGPKPMISAVIASFANRSDVSKEHLFYESA
jgi:NAD(P)H-flavin reductase